MWSYLIFFQLNMHEVCWCWTPAIFKTFWNLLFILFFKYILLFMLFVPFFSPLYAPPPCTLLPPAFPPLSSCPWVIHISSLASPFPILFLTSPCPFCAYQSCFLFPVPFPPFSPLPADNPPCDLHFCESVPVLAVCLVYFCFCFVSFLGLGVDHCEFVVTLLLVFFIFFFLDKSL